MLRAIIQDFFDYEVDAKGNVFSFKTGSYKKLKLGLMTSGYNFVSIRNDNDIKNKSVHRLVALNFVYNDAPENKTEVNHKNGIKTDNRAENLEWVTRSQNIQHSYDTGLKKYRPLHYKGMFGKDHNRSKSVKNTTTGKVYGSISEAFRKTGVPISTIRYRIKTSKDWKYANQQESNN